MPREATMRRTAACLLAAAGLLASGCAELGLGPRSDGSQAEAARLTRELTQAQAELARLTKQLGDLQQRHQAWAWQLRRIAAELEGGTPASWPATPQGTSSTPWPAAPQTTPTPPSPWPATPPPAQPVAGKVTAADPSAGLIVVDRGQRHGLAKGETLVIRRGGRYIGKAIVDGVFPDSATARCVSGEMMGAVQVGDGVTQAQPTP